MANKKEQNSNSPAVPFFARYLEGQLCEEVSEEDAEAVAGGSLMVTMKYPSDGEDAPSGGDYVTRKYPSDSDEVGHGYPIPLPPSGPVTAKAPSDSDEVGGWSIVANY